MAHKAELLTAMQIARSELEAIVAGFAGDLEQDAGDGWRRQDVLAHIALWERMAARKIAGTPLPDGEDIAAQQPWDLDRFNDTMIKRWRGRTAEQVLAEFAAAHASLVAAVEGADDAACAPGGRVWTAIDEDGAGHYTNHFPVTDVLAAQR